MTGSTHHPLHGVRAKIERAEESIEALDHEIQIFLGSQSRPHRELGRPKKGGSEYGFYVSMDSEPPLRFAVLAGEIIHHLRSSLDHIVWALVEHGGGTPTKHNQFPICLTKSDFEEACKRKRLDGVSERARHVIASIQPFVHDPPQDNPLALLHKLNIIDKHRLPILIGAAGQIGEGITFKGGGTGNVVISDLSPPHLRKIGSGEGEVFTIYLGAPEPALEIEADFEVHVAVESDTPVGLLPVTLVLSMCLTAVHRIVDLLGPEFA